MASDRLPVDPTLAEATTVAAAARALAGHLAATAPHAETELDEAADALARRVARLAGPPPGRIAIHAARLAAATRIDAIERAALEAVVDLTRLDSALIARLDARGHLAVRRTTGPLAEALEDAPPATLAAGGVLATGQVALSAPLLARAETRGVLVAADSQHASQACSPHARDLLELVAAQAAVALLAAAAAGPSAGHDPLTGLPGPSAFADALEQGGTARGTTRGVLLVEVDGFHDLATEAGRQAADRHLRAVASAVAGALRSGDELFRVGADELAAIVAVGDDGEALDAARRLRDASAALPGSASVAVGVALPREGESPSGVLARARATHRDAGVWLT